MESSYFYIDNVLPLVNFTAMHWILRCTALLSADFCQNHMMYLTAFKEKTSVTLPKYAYSLMFVNARASSNHNPNVHGMYPIICIIIYILFTVLHSQIKSSSCTVIFPVFLVALNILP